jgi:hypothetical protein
LIATTVWSFNIAQTKVLKCFADVPLIKFHNFNVKVNLKLEKLTDRQDELDILASNAVY